MVTNKFLLENDPKISQNGLRILNAFIILTCKGSGLSGMGGHFEGWGESGESSGGKGQGEG